MPVYLFTLHGHRTWMPGHPQGYTTRSKGYRAPDEKMNAAYERVAKHARVVFEDDFQRWLIDELIRCQAFIDVRLHAVATDSTHVHFLVSWSHDRAWESVRQSLRTSMTLRVRKELATDVGSEHGSMKPPVFSDGGSHRHVIDRDHLEHLLSNYLPKHSGLQWYESVGYANEPR